MNLRIVKPEKLEKTRTSGSSPGTNFVLVSSSFFDLQIAILDILATRRTTFFSFFSFFSFCSFLGQTKTIRKTQKKWSLERPFFLLFLVFLMTADSHIGYLGSRRTIFFSFFSFLVFLVFLVSLGIPKKLKKLKTVGPPRDHFF